MRQNSPVVKATARKDWFRGHQWLISRRLSQLSVIALFLVGPLFGWWFVKGNLSSSLILDTLPLTDPFVLLQTFVSGHIPEITAVIGAVIVSLLYLAIGGRSFCAWVCPVNMITDMAFWIREKLPFVSATSFSRKTRYWLLAAILILTLLQGQVVWELINPVSMFHRSLIFGGGLAWIILLMVFLFDLLITRRGWCSHLCPMGAFYSLLGTHSLIRVRADNRNACNDCLDCFRVCPEHQVIRPALKGAETGVGPVITSPNCTNCGRCIDVCVPGVFQFGLRFGNKTSIGHADHPDNAPGAEVL